MRPELNKSLPVETFNEYYWLGVELEAFCKTEELSTRGSKLEMVERIRIYLSTGEKAAPSTLSRPRGKFDDSNLSLDFVIPDNHRCSQKVRAFFEAQIPNFHFSTALQDFFKENVGATYREAIAFYKKQKEVGKTREISQIPPQFEFNIFVRDFFKDPKNKGLTRSDAIELWKVVRARPGSNRYKDIEV